MSQIFTFIEAKPGQMPPEGWRGICRIIYYDGTVKENTNMDLRAVTMYLELAVVKSVLWAKDITEEVRVEKKNAFLSGFICACAITQRNHKVDSIVYDTFVCNPMTIQEMKKAGVDDFDIEALKPVVKEWERKRKL